MFWIHVAVHIVVVVSYLLNSFLVVVLAGVYFVLKLRCIVCLVFKNVVPLLETNKS